MNTKCGFSSDPKNQANNDHLALKSNFFWKTKTESDQKLILLPHSQYLDLESLFQYIDTDINLVYISKFLRALDFSNYGIIERSGTSDQLAAEAKNKGIKGPPQNYQQPSNLLSNPLLMTPSSLAIPSDLLIPMLNTAVFLERQLLGVIKVYYLVFSIYT